MRDVFGLETRDGLRLPSVCDAPSSVYLTELETQAHRAAEPMIKGTIQDGRFRAQFCPSYTEGCFCGLQTQDLPFATQDF